MLAIRCQFLQGTYRASPPGRLSDSEWPPHPARLHIALTAAGWAWGGATFPEAAADALRWLERQPPPEVVVPLIDPPERTPATTFVPRNLSTREVSALHGHLRSGRLAAFQRGRGRVARVFPTRVVGDSPIWFVWPSAVPDGAVADALDRLAGELQYLGSSHSPVAGAAFVGDDLDVFEADGGTPLVANPSGSGGNLRVASVGLTDELIAGRFESRTAALGPTIPYGPKDDVRPTERTPTRGPFESLLVAHRVSGLALTLSHAVALTEALRTACLSQAGDAAPAALHGHGAHPHAAFLALPNVGGAYSDGTVMGLAVALPQVTPAADREAIRTAFGRVTLLNVANGQLKWRIGAADGSDLPWALQAGRWIGPATRWATVTPVIPDRHPKPRRGFSLEDAISKSFENALLPRPAKIEVWPAPLLSGALPANSHQRPGRLNGPATHVTVTFDERVVGPIAVGKGRYRGLGLFAPISPGGPAE
jgi:CRISPR-associated protein Csb2